MTGSFEGRVAVVTGGGRGIGRAHSVELAGEGAFVIINDLDHDAAAETVAVIESASGSPRRPSRGG